MFITYFIVTLKMWFHIGFPKCSERGQRGMVHHQPSTGAGTLSRVCKSQDKKQWRKTVCTLKIGEHSVSRNCQVYLIVTHYQGLPIILAIVAWKMILFYNAFMVWFDYSSFPLFSLGSMKLVVFKFIDSKSMNHLDSLKKKNIMVQNLFSNDKM